MADALTGVTETSATSEEIVAMQVQDVLTNAVVCWPLLSDYSSMVGPGMDNLHIPAFGNFTVGTKAENTAADAQVNAFSVDTLALDQYKYIQFLVEDIASLQAKVAVTQHYVEQAGKDLAAEMDAFALGVLDDGVSTSAPAHDIAYADTVNEDLERQDILEAKRLLDVANVPMSERSAIISPAQEKNLLLINEFVLVNESGAQAALRNGQIGRLFGFDIFVSNQIPATDGNPTYFIHKSAAAVARQMMPKVEMERDLPNLGDRWSLSHIYGGKILDGGKRMVRFTETA